MIPKPLNEIEWCDIEALRDSGREEDDTIEFKGSFKGGSDFLAFNENQQATAVDSIAKEVIAFLNSRGGDIIVGASEFKNDHPRIEALTSLRNVGATADRLAQSLAALIEPAQSVLSVRAIKQSDLDANGVIVIRAPSSLRAPHRSKRTKDCFIRRGRESVPMPMDEVQDLTLNRALARSERDNLLDSQFADLRGTRFGVIELSEDRVHFRVCFMPDKHDEIALDSPTLSTFLGTDPVVENGREKFRNDVAFRQLNSHWKPQLRGMNLTGHNEYNSDFQYCAKIIKRSGIMICDFATRASEDRFGSLQMYVHYDCLVGFLANSLHSMRDVVCQRPALTRGKIRIAAWFEEGHKLARGGRMGGQVYDLPVGGVSLPDFEVLGLESYDEIFRQAQIDFCAIAGLDCPNPYSFQNP